MKTLVLLVALLWTGVAAAAEFEGVVTQLDFQRRVVSVTAPGACECEAIPFIVPADVSLAGISPGTTVKVVYTTAGTTNTVAKISK